MGRRALVVWALAVLVLAGCASAGARPHALLAATATATATPAPPRILFVGDSLTAGFAATTVAQSYAEIVVAALHAERVNGSAQYGISALGVALNFRVTPPPSGANDIVIELGTNDGGLPADFSAASVS